MAFVIFNEVTSKLVPPPMAPMEDPTFLQDGVLPPHFEGEHEDMEMQREDVEEVTEILTPENPPIDPESEYPMDVNENLDMEEDDHVS